MPGKHTHTVNLKYILMLCHPMKSATMFGGIQHLKESLKHFLNEGFDCQRDPVSFLRKHIVPNSIN